MRVAVSKNGSILDRIKIVPTPASFKGGLKKIAEITREISGGRKIKIVSGGLAGSFDRKKTKIISGGSNIKEWLRKPIRSELGELFRTKVYLENDASLAGLAESKIGSGRGYKIVVYLTVGTDLGGSRIVDGKIDISAAGFEPSYQIVDAGGGLCRMCKGKTIGSHISGRGIEKHFGLRPEEMENSKIREDLAFWLALAINNAAVHWSPDVVVLGGSVMRIIPFVKVRSKFKEIFRAFSHPPALKKAKLGDLGVLHGALILARQSKRPLYIK